MKKGFIVLMVLNLMILSSWESLSFFHSLLHLIPNPFHNHNHHIVLPVYHHDYLDPRTSHSHSHEEVLHDHSLVDHLDRHQEKGNDPLPYSRSSDSDPLKDFFKLTGKLEKTIFSENYFKVDFQIANAFALNLFPFSSKGKPDVPPPKTA